MRQTLCVIFTVLPVATAFAGMPRHPLPVHREGEVLVTYRDALVAKRAGTLKSELGLSTRRQLRGGRMELLALPAYMTTDNAIELLRDDPAVERVGPNFLRFPRQTLPDDTHFAQQWGLHNTGQANFSSAPDAPASVVDADMDLPEAWDSDGNGTFDRTGDGTVTIAIIDDSFATTHEDLAANFVAGRNFENGGTNVSPVGDEAHGTLVAGAAGAIGNNAKGVAGTAWNVKLMPLKFDFDTAGHIAALEFAAASGADIVNASFGGPGFDQGELDAIEALGDILYVAAAGNDDSNTDFAQLNYPANLDAPNILSVAATNRQDNIASFSQYGALTTDVAAPGLQIVTTTKTPGYSVPSNCGTAGGSCGVSGTSFSAPYTAGIAALLKSHVTPAPGFMEMKARLIEGAEPVNDVAQRTAGGRVNAANSLDIAARPALVIDSIDWVDDNDRLDPGETLSVDITLRNLWEDATTVTGTLAADNGVTVAADPVAFNDIPGNATATARFDLDVAADVIGHRYVHFTLQLQADGYAATRGFIAEIGELNLTPQVTQTFAAIDDDLYDDFHAWHLDFDGTLPGDHNQLVIETTSTSAVEASPDIDLLVKQGVPPRYSITVGINPETDDGFFCTSGTTSNCRDPATALSAGPDGAEQVVISNPTAGTYHIVVVNFAQLEDGMTYTLRAYTRHGNTSAGRGGGGGGLPPLALTVFVLALLARRRLRGA